ncbi:cadmium-induced protein AS8 isoform X2 [Nymphaea colorata]|uniref:cadmium-induced protein AS8 isoform X2 n=1 Tax=Nymphaea colorata TaxID=210225 RepID=UPI00129EEFCD|nr:cadmium-induced protein AS8 isoform X2 [Nymphaea colorata]
MVNMIIKGLFRKYEKWNPVHPTSGTFWGMGIGVGCGVGWGPGFGPEVIGYVGAGCGFGFSVGITLAGVGIGLPANGLIQAPYNAFSVTGNSTLKFARSNVIPAMKNAAENWWTQICHIHDFHAEATGRLSADKVRHMLLPSGVNLVELKRNLSLASEFLNRPRNTYLSFGKGSGSGTK